MSDPPRNRHGEERETPFPLRPAHLAEDGSGELEESEGDVDSEPRRKWTPNPELLRALADARRDLKPGEASLFWDWTATRDSAPPAEDVRPSGEGEEGRKLVFLAIGLGCFTGILVFFWLHAPSPPRPEQAPPKSVLSAAPQESSAPARAGASPPVGESPRAPLSPAAPEPRSLIVSHESVSSNGASSTSVDKRTRERDARKGERLELSMRFLHRLLAPRWPVRRAR